MNIITTLLEKLAAWRRPELPSYADGRLQDDLPLEDRVYHIVRDYQRMFREYHKLKAKADVTEDLIAKRAKQMSERRPDEVTRLQNALAERNTTIEVLKREKDTALQQLKSAQDKLAKRPAWHPERCQAATDQTDKLIRQIDSLREAIRALPLPPERKNVMSSFADDCRNQANRIRASITNILPSNLRRKEKQTKQ